jgi:hypothetical protein
MIMTENTTPKKVPVKRVPAKPKAKVETPKAAKPEATKPAGTKPDVWFTLPAVDRLGIPQVSVPKDLTKIELPKFELPKVDLPKVSDVDVRAFAEQARDRAHATATDVRKNVSHTVTLLREVVGV